MLQRLSNSNRRQSFASLPVHFLFCSGRRLRCSSLLCSPSLPYALKTPTQPTTPQQPCYCPPSTRNCSWGSPALQSAVSVYERAAPRAMLIDNAYEVIISSRVLQEALGVTAQPGCKQRVQAPDVWEVVFHFTLTYGIAISIVNCPCTSRCMW
jgi:hypothetical protein